MAKALYAFCFVLCVCALICIGLWALRSYAATIRLIADQSVGSMEPVYASYILGILYSGYLWCLRHRRHSPVLRICGVACITLFIAICPFAFDEIKLRRAAQVGSCIFSGLLIAAIWAGSLRDHAPPRSRVLLAVIVLPSLFGATYLSGSYSAGAFPYYHVPITPPTRLDELYGSIPVKEISPVSPSSGSMEADSTRLGVRSPQAGLTARSDDKGTLILSNATGSEELLMKQEREIGFLEIIAFSPDGSLLAVSDTSFVNNLQESQVKVWRVEGGKGRKPIKADPLFAVTTAGEHIRALAIAADNKTLVTSTESVQFWDMPSKTVVRQFVPRHRRRWWDLPDVTDCMAISPDGKILATWTLEGSILLWDWGSLQCLRSLGPVDEFGCSLGFCPDSRTLIAVSKESEMHWSVRAAKWPFITLGLVSLCAISTIVSTCGSRPIWQRVNKADAAAAALQEVGIEVRPTNPESQAWGIASLVCGVVAIFTFWVFGFGVTTAVCATVFYSIQFWSWVLG